MKRRNFIATAVGGIASLFTWNATANPVNECLITDNWDDCEGVDILSRLQVSPRTTVIDGVLHEIRPMCRIYPQPDGSTVAHNYNEYRPITETEE